MGVIAYLDWQSGASHALTDGILRFPAKIEENGNTSPPRKFWLC